MEIISQTLVMQKRAKEIQRAGKSIGLVPTMGYFHEGHLSLMRAAREETDYVAVSLFVNPIQFGPSEDLDRYPRDLDRDRLMAEKLGVDVIFCPTVEDMYPSGFLTKVSVEGLSEKLCGASRPGHFVGVTTVVSKLFNIVAPDYAYFGQKDAQQAIIIQRMTRDLNFGTCIRILPIVRENDGLAMSSRNVYLSDNERRAATCLYNAIKEAEAMFKKGERKVGPLLARAGSIIRSEPLAEMEYMEICHIEDLSAVNKIEDKALLALAIRIGRTRLIDNTILERG